MRVHSMCVCGGARRLQRRAQASHGFEWEALTIKAHVHYDSVIKILRRYYTIRTTLSPFV